MSRRANINKPHIILHKQEKTDRELWVEMFCAVASASNTNKVEVAVRWANEGMEKLKEWECQNAKS